MPSQGMSGPAASSVSCRASVFQVNGVWNFKLGGGIDRRPPPVGRRDSAAGFKSRPCKDISFPDSPRGHGGNPPARCRIV